MIRNLKAMGLALVALFALSAVVASAASAEEEPPTNGFFTADEDGDFYLKGTDEKEGDGNHLTYFNESTELVDSITCPESHYTVEGVGGGPISSGAETVTVTPTYTNCKSGEFPTTVTMNGCDFVFHIGETVVANTNYTVTADLKCPEGKAVTVEVYSGSGEALKLCTVTFGEENNQGLDATSGENVTIEEVETNEFRVTGTFAHITATKEGLCGHDHTSLAEYDVDVTLTGYDADELEETHVELKH